MSSLEKTIVLPQGSDTFVSLMFLCFSFWWYCELIGLFGDEMQQKVATLFYSLFVFFQGAHILSAAKELGQLSKLKVL